MELLKELVGFMAPNQRIDLKVVALTEVLGLTGTPEGKATLLGFDEMLAAIFGLTFDSTATISKDAVLTLINLTAEEEGAIKVLETSKNLHPKFEIIQEAVKHITDQNSELSDPWTMVLSNLTRVERLVGQILDELEKDEKTMLNLAKAFSNVDYNKKKAKLNYLAPIFCNLTQISRGREIVCNSKYNLLDKIIPFASYDGSIVRRGGTLGILKNICFDPVYHHVILNDKDDILYCLLYPLAGPEEFDEEENEKFPMELQFLGEDKTREEDPDLRKMILESLLQLCATKKYRELLRAKGTYEILREYHKWEAKIGKDNEALLACENVVDILIRKEEEIGLDNLKEIEVPEDIGKKFIEDDEAYLKN
ncbi:protein HGH1 homolog [Eupeodes corollae]|uniref:protein HGH1 homolog n=1 Tax=Eupeodes corollae TaxID=290404 RepID=UPI00248F6F57|nr:protein HGH1 homolog [Eupeodes corollae]